MTETRFELVDPPGRRRRVGRHDALWNAVLQAAETSQAVRVPLEYGYPGTLRVALGVRARIANRRLHIRTDIDHMTLWLERSDI